MSGADWRQQEECEMRLWAQVYGPACRALNSTRKGNGMNINEAFPSDYLKAVDLKGRKLRVTISHVEMADLGDSKKPVVMFQGKDKGLVLNKTNAMAVSSAYGPDTDEWAGKEIAIYPAKTQFQGQMVDCIRCEPVLAEATSDEVPF